MKYYLLVLTLFSFSLLFAVFNDNASTISDTLVNTSPGIQDSTYLDSLTNYVLYAQPPVPVKPVESPSFSWMMIKMIATLIMISILMYLILRFVKGLNQNQLINSDKLIKVLESQPVGFKQYIQIISIHKTLYILSSGSNNTQIIDKIEDPVIIEEILQKKNTKNISNFNHILNKFKAKKG